MESTTQIFLRVQRSEDESDVVKGEGRVGGYAGRVQIDSFDFGMKSKLQAPAKPDQKVTNNLDFDPVKVSKVFDKASMGLAALLRDRKQLYEVRITVDQQLEDYEEKVGKAQNAIIVFHLMQARIVDIKLDVSEDKAGATIKETVSFSFKNFAVEYYYKGTKNNKKSDYRDKAHWFETEYETQD
jgi:type VI protein secretion system component Hcp